jgi:hypothetical protein
MWGTIILLARDFYQILPVIPNVTPADELNACLKASYLFNYVSKLSLTTNMRVQMHNNSTAQSFPKQLLALGDGRVQCDPSTGCLSFWADFWSQVQSMGFPTLKTTTFKNSGNVTEPSLLQKKSEQVILICWYYLWSIISCLLSHIIS